MALVFIALGSNLESERMREEYLAEALRLLEPSVEGLRLSPVYQTAPKYLLDQPPFLNAVARGTAVLAPLCLLKRLKAIEQMLGRTEGVRNGPREIDLDLISYGTLRYRYGDTLIVPHPRAAERRFVLQPMADLDPMAQLVGIGAVGDLLLKTNDPPESVQLYTDAVLPLHRN